MLYFFSAFGWQYENGEVHPDLSWERSDEPDFSQVLYYDGALDQLRRHPRPDDKKVFKAVAIDFVEILSLPRAYKYDRDPVLAALNWNEDEFKQFAVLYEDFEFVINRTVGVTPHHKLLGYPETMQRAVTSADTRLLCQIDSDYHNAGGDMMFEDGGIIYFTIEQARLEQGDYSRVGSNMQSG